MTVDELFGLLPETRREEGKAAIAELSKGYVKIDGPDIAAKVMGENQYLKSILESETSKRVANHDTKFQAEKLPGIVEEEIRKRGPKPKDPEVAALSDKLTAIEAENAKIKADAIKDQQRARAIKALSEKGLPAALAERYIGQTDADTDEALKGLFEVIDPVIKSKVDESIKARIGGGQPLAGGGVPKKRDELQAKYTELMRAQRFQEALKVQDEMSKMPRE